MTTAYMPDDRHLAALERQRERIAAGLELLAADDTSVGSKDTSCTWGLCSGEREAWPDAQDHLWPDEFTSRGRIAPRYRQGHQACPLDSRPRSADTSFGCFYSCKVFQGRDRRVVRGEIPGLPDRAETLRLYDVEIARVRARGVKP